MASLTPLLKLLVTSNMDLVRLAVNATVSRSNRRSDYHGYDDMTSEASKALVEAAVRWPTYCAEHGYESDSNEWFRIFATRRMKGSIIDMWRKDSPLTRTELDHSTFALRHGIPEAAAKFNVPIERIQQSLSRRDALITTEELPETEEAREAQTFWDVLSHEIDGLPQIARVWLALVFVHHIPVMEARKLVGLKDIPRASTLQGFVEYTLIHAVLTQRVEQPEMAA